MAGGKVCIHLQYFLTLLYGFVESMSDAEGIRYVCVDNKGKRIETLRCFQLRHGIGISSENEEMPGIPLMRRRITRTEFNCLLEFRIGSVPIPAIKIQSESQGGVRLAEAIVQFQRLGRGRRGQGKSLARRNYAVFPIARDCVGVRQA